MAQSILMTPFFQDIILPFVLVFTVIFAVLQKTKILGADKKQIDALVALSIGLIVISFGNAVGIISSLIPFLAISAITILVFMLLYGMAFVNSTFTMNKYIVGAIGGLVAVGVIAVLLVSTGAWDELFNRFFSDSAESSSLITNVLIIAAVVAAVIIALVGGGSGSKGKDKKD